jgi:hypothetical protein
MNEQSNSLTTLPSNMNKSDNTKKGFPKKTLMLIIGLALIAIGLIALALNKNKTFQSTQTAQPVIETPTLSDSVQTILSFSPLPIRLATPSSFSSDILINTGQDHVNKVQLEISYDPKILTKVDITAGPYFTDPQVLIKTIDSENGRISFALGVQNGEKGLLGQGVLAKLTFSMLQKNTTATASAGFLLLPKSQVSADGIYESVLKSTIDAKYNLSNSPETVKSGK